MEKTEKITREIAKKDFEGWLNHKKIKERKRQVNEDQEETIIDSIMAGSLRVEKDFNLHFNLDFPLENDKKEVTVREFVFKPRIKVFELNAKLKGVKASDGDGRVVAYISAITGQNSGIIKKLDTEDYNICQSIVMYFL